MLGKLDKRNVRNMALTQQRDSSTVTVVKKSWLKFTIRSSLSCVFELFCFFRTASSKLNAYMAQKAPTRKPVSQVAITERKQEIEP